MAECSDLYLMIGMRTKLGLFLLVSALAVKARAGSIVDLAPALAPSEPREARVYSTSAEQAFDAGNYEQAQNLYQSLLTSVQQTSNAPWIHMRLCRVFEISRDQDNWENCLSFLRSGYGRTSKWYSAFHKEPASLAAREEVVATNLRALRSLFPSNTGKLSSMQTVRREMVLKELNEHYGDLPSMHKVAFQQARMHHAKNNLQSAAESYLVAAENSPKSVRAWDGLTLALAEDFQKPESWKKDDWSLVAENEPQRQRDENLASRIQQSVQQNKVPKQRIDELNLYSARLYARCGKTREASGLLVHVMRNCLDPRFIAVAIKGLMQIYTDN